MARDEKRRFQMKGEVVCPSEAKASITLIWNRISSRAIHYIFHINCIDTESFNVWSQLELDNFLLIANDISKFEINKSYSDRVVDRTEMIATSFSGQKRMNFCPREENYCISLKLSGFNWLSRHWNSQFQCRLYEK